jgi:hypothetical protein
MAFVSMAPAQWDALLQSAYDAGWVLLEVDDEAGVVRAFRREGAS